MTSPSHGCDSPPSLPPSPSPSSFLPALLPPSLPHIHTPHTVALTFLTLSHSHTSHCHTHTPHCHTHTSHTHFTLSHSHTTHTHTVTLSHISHTHTHTVTHTPHCHTHTSHTHTPVLTHSRFTDKLTIVISHGVSFTVELSAEEGRGTTIVSHPPLQPSVALGPHFNRAPCQHQFNRYSKCTVRHEAVSPPCQSNALSTHILLAVCVRVCAGEEDAGSLLDKKLKKAEIEWSSRDSLDVAKKVGMCAQDPTQDVCVPA